MFFCRKKQPWLNAERAYQLTLINNEKMKMERHKRLLEIIYGQVKYGCFKVNFNLTHDRFLCTEDIPYLESLGYKVETREQRINIDYLTSHFQTGKYYVVSWDKENNF